MPCRLFEVGWGKPTTESHPLYGAPSSCTLLYALAASYTGDGSPLNDNQYQTHLYKIGIRDQGIHEGSFVANLTIVGLFSFSRQTLASADRVGKLTVFNIIGNKVRLVAAIHYNRRKIYVRAVLTHAEYDEQRWRK